MKNLLKEKFVGKTPIFGTFITIGHPEISEALASVGLDYLLIDMEHSPISMETAELLLQAMSSSSTTPLIRVAWNDQVMVKRALDIGAHGIAFPFVNTKEEAMRAVSSVKYPPQGIRGYGPRRPEIVEKDYFKDANKEILVAVQIESPEAVRNIDEILSVPGVDIAIVGPSDLSLTLGVFDMKDDAMFKSAIRKIVNACENKGVVPCIYSNYDEVQRWLRDGFRMLIVETDLSLLLKEGRALADLRNS